MRMGFLFAFLLGSKKSKRWRQDRKYLLEESELSGVVARCFPFEMYVKVQNLACGGQHVDMGRWRRQAKKKC